MLSEIEDNIRIELLKMKKQMECPICLQLMTDPMITRCVHRFCSVCIHKSIQSSTHEYCRCPLCNEKITKRSLRPQTDISHLITAFKEAVDCFEEDNDKSIINNADDVVIFDVSTDKSKSCVDSNDSTEASTDSKAIESEATVMTDETIPLDDWPTCETITTTDDNHESATDVIETSAESTNVSFYDKCVQKKALMEKNVNPSQNLTVNKSRITYSASKKPVNDKFDQIINSSNFKINQNYGNKEKTTKDKLNVSSDSEAEVQSIDSKPKRKPLMLLKDKQNKEFKPKKKFKRVESLLSSDDEFEPQVVVKSKRSAAVESRENRWLNQSDDELSAH